MGRPELEAARTGQSLTLVRGRRQVCCRAKARKRHVRRRADVASPVGGRRSRQARFRSVAMHRAHHIVLAGLTDTFHSKVNSVATVHGRDELSAERCDLTQCGEQGNDGKV